MQKYKSEIILMENHILFHRSSDKIVPIVVMVILNIKETVNHFFNETILSKGSVYYKLLTYFTVFGLIINRFFLCKPYKIINIFVKLHKRYSASLRI